MQSDWLAATNFERMHEVVSAINTLEIHAKLTGAGIADPTPAPEIESARHQLLVFLEQLASTMLNARTTGNELAVGTDPRLRELTHRLSGRGGQRDERSHPTTVSPGEISELIRIEDEESLRNAVPKLERLRMLIEEHMQADVAGILGDESW